MTKNKSHGKNNVKGFVIIWMQNFFIQHGFQKRRINKQIQKIPFAVSFHTMYGVLLFLMIEFLFSHAVTLV